MAKKHILIATNAFKGSLSCIEAANAISRGIKKSNPDAKIIICPISDGGDGLLDVVKSIPPARPIRCKVIGPRGKTIDSEYCWIAKEKTVFIEMALASGLALLPEKLRNPMETTSYGTGQLLAAALRRKPAKIILGIGGSATCDGGTGAAAALGARFIGAHSEVIGFPCGKDLGRIIDIDLSGINPALNSTPIEIICDVDNPLLGPRGSAAVYAPQKGATPAQVQELERGLANFAKIIRKVTEKDVRRIPGGGAAGGISAGFHGLFDAELRKGIEVVFELVHLEEKIKEADLVITGEGKIDTQTAYGKAPAGVAKLAKKHGIPCIAIAGMLGEGYSSLKRIGIKDFYALCKSPEDAPECMRNAAAYLETLASKIFSARA